MRRLIIFLNLIVILSACAGKPAQDTNTSETSAVSSPAATEPAATVVPTLAPTTAPTLTASPQPTWTNAPSPTPEPTATPACTNQAEFIRHLSISDNTELTPDTYFSKIWRIKNIGTCTWGEGYQLIFREGEPMGFASEIPIPIVVLPGELLDMKVVLHTPLLPGAYTGAWMLRDPFGQVFGIGENADQPLKAVITVKEILRNKRLETLDCGG
jgi:hypothetical protein